MGTTLMLALGLMLVLEGLLPFISPSAWRQVFRQAISMRDGQLRFIGLGSIGLGLLIRLFLR